MLSVVFFVVAWLVYWDNRTYGTRLCVPWFMPVVEMPGLCCFLRVHVAHSIRTRITAVHWIWMVHSL